MKGSVFFVLAIMLIFAAYVPVCGAAEEPGADEDKASTANDKFTRGVVNISTCYLEVPMTVYKTSKEENPITGVLFGIPAGIARGAVRLVVGVIELGTFPFQPYEPMLEPEYLIIKE